MPTPKERLLALTAYVKETSRLRQKPVASLSQHRQFHIFQEQLQRLPGLVLDTESPDGSSIWLKLHRLHETRCPKPTDRLLDLWLEIPESPMQQPTLRSRVLKGNLVHLGALPPGPEPDTDELKLDSSFINLAHFEGKEALQTAFETFLNTTWSPWALEEQGRRKSIRLYHELFMLAQKLQGNLGDGGLELAWGMGIAAQELPETSIQYPLLTQQLDLSINPDDMSVEIMPRNTPVRLELDVFAALDNPGLAALSATAKQFLEEEGAAIVPFEPASYEKLLRSATSLLDASGIYYRDHTNASDISLPRAKDKLVVSDTWVIFARPRTNNLLLADLERLEHALSAPEAELPPAVRAIVTEPSDTSVHLQLPAFRGLSRTDADGHMRSGPVQELYFPLPYNEEQVQIARYLEVQDGVVVQGPPGTGKTHTIANIICHYLATGKRVLVSSMKDPALAVLRDKLPEEIRPLAISLLASEADGMKQFEHAINKISLEVQAMNQPAVAQEVAALDQRIERLQQSLQEVLQEVSAWAEAHLSPIDSPLGLLEPREAAQLVVQARERIAWFPDALGLEADFDPTFGEAGITALRDARRALGRLLPYLGKTVPALDSLPDSHSLLQLHQDLSQAALLRHKIAATEIPALADSQPQTMEAAMQLQEALKRHQQLLLELRQNDSPWMQSMQNRIRTGDADELFRLLDALHADLLEANKHRTAYLARPVSLPAGLETQDEVVAAVENLSQGQKAFGLAGLFGKKQEKQQLEQIRIIDERPKTESDWQYVLVYIRLQQRIKGLLLRWNHLAAEFSLPLLSFEHTSVSEAIRICSLYQKLLQQAEEESLLLNRLNQLLPGWRPDAAMGWNSEQISSLEQILGQHIQAYRLSAGKARLEQWLNALAGCEGAVCTQIKELLSHQIGDPQHTEAGIQLRWAELIAELRLIADAAPHFNTVAQLSGLIEASGAPQWARMLQSQPITAGMDTLLPADWAEVWQLRRLSTYMEQQQGHEALRLLSERQHSLEQELAAAYQEAVSRRSWLQLASQATHSVRAGLEAYRSAIRRIGKGTGLRSARYREDARQAATLAAAAVPCWIMPHFRISESLPAAPGWFDLLIIDEASQSDLSALPALLRAKKVLIVGDDKQVAPEGVGLEEEKIRSLNSRFLSSQVPLYRPLMTPERSVYDLFKAVFAGGSVMLREHFRSVAPIIAYSKKHFYNHELRPLRLPRASERLDPPLLDIYIEGGRRSGHTNEAEAQYIVAEIGRIVQDPDMKGRTIGVVSLLGQEQALMIMELLGRELGSELITRFEIACGDARTFQGKEKDIIFLSMVVSEGQAKALSGAAYEQRFNVAASRARDRMYLVRSIQPEALSASDQLRLGLIRHMQHPMEAASGVQQSLLPAAKTDLAGELQAWLQAQGYQVLPRLRVGQYRIDLVVEGAQDRRMAIACAGDEPFIAGQWEQELRQQRVLERAGWSFWRCFAADYILRQEAVLAELAAVLNTQGIQPHDGVQRGPGQYSEHRVIRAGAEEACGDC